MRQLTAHEKRLIAIKRTRNKIVQNKKVLVLGILGIVLVLGLVIFLFYMANRSDRFSTILGSNCDEIEWMYGGEHNSDTVDDLKRYTLDRVYPGSVDTNGSEECKFYKGGGYVGSVTFLESGNLLIHENKIYEYNANKKE